MFANELLGRTLYGKTPDRVSSTDVVRLPAQSGGAVDVKVKELPLCVRFADLDDFHSVSEVDPEDLSTAYGPSARFIGARLEVTSDSITHQLRRHAPRLYDWAVANPRQCLAGTMLRDRDANLAARICGQDLARTSLIAGDPCKEPARPARKQPSDSDAS